jgi:PKD domain
MKSIFMRKLFRLVLAFLFGSQAFGQKNEDLSVLFVGNSYTHMNDMPFLFDRIAKSKGKSIHVEMNTRSSATFNIHTTRPDLFESIKSRKWDFVVLQGFSRELSFDPEYIDTASIPYFNQIVDSVKANHPCTNILLYMTWGYKEGYQHIEDVNTYEKMTSKITDGYKYLSKMYNLPVVPVGQVWKEFRQQNPDIELYDKDKEHPSKKGSYLAACTFFASIYKESPEGAVTSTLRNEYAEKIQKMAGDYVLANFNSYNLNQNFFSIDWRVENNGSFWLNGMSNFENAKSILWDFGDGTTAKTSMVKHRYNNPGEYELTLTIEDECGVREIKRKVKFSEPKGPKRKPKVRPIKGNKLRKKS